MVLLVPASRGILPISSAAEDSEDEDEAVDELSASEDGDDGCCKLEEIPRVLATLGGLLLTAENGVEETVLEPVADPKRHPERCEDLCAVGPPPRSRIRASKGCGELLVPTEDDKTPFKICPVRTSPGGAPGGWGVTGAAELVTKVEGCWWMSMESLRLPGKAGEELPKVVPKSPLRGKDNPRGVNGSETKMEVAEIAKAGSPVILGGKLPSLAKHAPFFEAFLLGTKLGLETEAIGS